MHFILLVKRTKNWPMILSPWHWACLNRGRTKQKGKGTRNGQGKTGRCEEGKGTRKGSGRWMACLPPKLSWTRKSGANHPAILTCPRLPHPGKYNKICANNMETILEVACRNLLFTAWVYVTYIQTFPITTRKFVKIQRKYSCFHSENCL